MSIEEVDMIYSNGYPRETIKEAGYERLGMYLGGHVLRRYGKLELWMKSKNYAGYALIYGNTHLEFCSSLKPEQVPDLV